MNRFLATSLFIVALAAPLQAPPALASPLVAVDVSFFVSELDPWGRWVEVEPWGLVWVPDGVGPAWQPYLYGRWDYSDYGWAWVSSDPWSPYPYHYGTWVYTALYGWVWVPGTVWAPAWVTWCWTDGYVGWAPVAPGFSIALSGSVSTGGFAPASSFVFVPVRTFASGDVATARVPLSRNSTLVRTSTRLPAFTVRDGIVRTAGPSRERVERTAGVPVRMSKGWDSRVAVTRIPSDVLGARRTAPVVAPRRMRDEAAPRAERGPSRGRRDEVAPRAESRSSRPGHGSVVPRVESRPSRPGHDSAVPRVQSRPSHASRVEAAPQPRERVSHRTKDREEARSRAPERPPRLAREEPAPRSETRSQRFRAPTPREPSPSRLEERRPRAPALVREGPAAPEARRLGPRPAPPAPPRPEDAFGNGKPRKDDRSRGRGDSPG